MKPEDRRAGHKMKAELFTLSLIAAYGALVVLSLIFMSGLELPGGPAATGGCEPLTCDTGGYDCGEWDDGCNGTIDCGSCQTDEKCSDKGLCVEKESEEEPEEECDPVTCSILGHECGTWWDGCGGSLNCGECDGTDLCINGKCVSSCVPISCSDKEYACGNWSNGCGGNISCGKCNEGFKCSTSGSCVAEGCVENCSCAALTCVGKNCSNGCGGWCEGTLEPDDCGDRECGYTPNQCGTCGNCTAPETCHNGTCMEGECTPDCDGKECGDDGCGGLCGECFNINSLNPCSGDMCNPTCDTGWGNCDGNYSNGCETNTNENEAHCGACNMPCQTGYNCFAGICTQGCAVQTCGELGKECDEWQDDCGNQLDCGDCGPTETCNSTGQCELVCTPDCSCAADTCEGETCPNGCSDTCDGTKTGDCACSSSTCIGDTCDGGCGVTCDGTMACASGPLKLNMTFDDVSGNTVYDQSDYEHDGTIYGDAHTVEGMFGNGMEFDGDNDRVEIGPIEVTGDKLTLSAWFKLDSIPVNKDGRIIAKGQSTTFQDWTLQIGRYAYAEFRVANTTDADKEDIKVADTLSTVNVGEWYHIAGVYNGTQATLYLNCMPIATKAKTGNLKTSSNPVWIGDQPTNEGFMEFPGVVDEVRVYSRALSRSEIEAIYTRCPTCPPCKDPMEDLPSTSPSVG